MRKKIQNIYGDSLPPLVPLYLPMYLPTSPCTSIPASSSPTIFLSPLYLPLLPQLSLCTWLSSLVLPPLSLFLYSLSCLTSCHHLGLTYLAFFPPSHYAFSPHLYLSYLLQSSPASMSLSLPYPSLSSPLAQSLSPVMWQLDIWTLKWRTGGGKSLLFFRRLPDVSGDNLGKT